MKQQNMIQQAQNAAWAFDRVMEQELQNIPNVQAKAFFFKVISSMLGYGHHYYAGIRFHGVDGVNNEKPFPLAEAIRLSWFLLNPESSCNLKHTVWKSDGDRYLDTF